jgi:prokaryotic ubiquitin-like protein Pup
MLRKERPKDPGWLGQRMVSCRVASLSEWRAAPIQAERSREMAAQERKQKRVEGPPAGDSGAPSAQVTEKGKQLKDDLDKLMDEIDGVLEENAEEFMKSYVQRGGE